MFEPNEVLALSNLIASDASVISALHKRCFSQPWTTTDFLRFARAEECDGVVARIGEVVAGFIVIRIIADEAEVLTLAVDGPWRRQGVASAILEQAMTVAAGRGAATLFLEVGVRNDAARALYKGLRFIRAGRRARYYTTPDGPEDALVMKRDLMSEAVQPFTDAPLEPASINSVE